jgi:WD40 repeat protein
MRGGASAEVRDVAFSPAGGVVAVSSYQRITLYDFATWHVIGEFVSPSNEFFSGIAYTPDGSAIAAANESRVILFSVVDGSPLWFRGLPNDSALSIAVSPDNQYIAVGSSLRSCVYLLRRSDGTIVRQWTHHTREVTSVQFTPDGQRVISTAPDGEVCVWRVDSDTLARRYSFGAGAHRASALSPDGRTLAVVGFDNGTVRLIDPDTGASRATLQTPAPAHRAAFTPDGRYLAVGVNLPSPSVHVWRLSDMTLLYPPYPDSEPRTESVRVVAVSPDSQFWIEAGQNTQLPVRRFDTGALVGYMIPFYNETPVLRFAPDSQSLYTASPRSGWLYQWDCLTGEGVAPAFREVGGIESFAVDGAGRWLAIAVRDARAIRLRDRSTGAFWVQFPAGTSWMRTGQILDFTADGTRLYVAPWMRGGVAVWRLLSDGVLFERAIGTGVGRAAYSPNGRYIAVYDTQQITVWDAGTGAHLATRTNLPEFPAGLSDLVFSPDGTLLAFGGYYSRFYVWRWQTGAFQEFLLPANFLYALAFTPDGNAFVAASDDQKLRFWRATDWQPWVEFSGWIAGATALQFSPDGKLLGLGRLDGAFAVARNPFYPDLDNSGVVDDADLLTVLFQFGETGSNLAADVNYDGVVDDADLLTVLFYFGP